MNKIVAICELMRLDKPVGIYLLMWPALLALVIGTQGSFQPLQTFIVIVGSILVRSAGCVINDLWDKDLDGNVERTKNRPLPSQKLTSTEGWSVFVVLGGLSFALLSLTNINTLIVSIAFGAMIVIYPLTKRFIAGPQLFLGLTFNPVIIVYAMTEQLNNPTILLLYFAVSALTIAYDSFYGLCDQQDDVKLGINSTAIWWGKNTLKVIGIFQALSMCLLGMIGWLDQLNFIWFLGVLGLGLFFIYQHSLADKNEYLAAFKNNHWASLFMLFNATACYLN